MRQRHSTCDKSYSAMNALGDPDSAAVRSQAWTLPMVPHADNLKITRFASGCFHRTLVNANIISALAAIEDLSLGAGGMFCTASERTCLASRRDPMIVAVWKYFRADTRSMRMTVSTRSRKVPLFWHTNSRAST